MVQFLDRFESKWVDNKKNGDYCLNFGKTLQILAIFGFFMAIRRISPVTTGAAGFRHKPGHPPQVIRDSQEDMPSMGMGFSQALVTQYFSGNWGVIPLDFLLYRPPVNQVINLVQEVALVGASAVANVKIGKTHNILHN